MADTENLLLAKVINDGAMLDMVEAKIGSHHFISGDHLKVFEWMTAHWSAHGVSPSQQALRRQFPLYELPETPEPVAYYVSEMHRLFRYDVLSEAVQDSINLLAEGKDTAEAETILSRALSGMQTVTSSSRDHDLTDPEAFSKLYDHYEELTKNPGALRGVETGYRSIDLATMGYQTGQLIVFAGPPKAGKSTVMLSSADAVVRAGHDVVLMSFEMSFAEQQARWVGMRAKTNYRRLLKGGMNDRDRDRLDAMDNDLNDSNLAKLILSEDTSSTTTVSGIIAKIQQHKPKVLFIDGVYLMLDENGEAPGSSQALTNITRSLKRAAQANDITIVISTQTLTSKMRAGKEVTASSVGYSSSFAQDADVLIGIEPRISDSTGLDEHWLKVLLSRQGPLVTIEIDFNWSTSTFTEIGNAGEYDDDMIDGG